MNAFLLPCAIALCLSPLIAHAETDAALAPALEAEPAADGLVTWWLYSPVQKVALEKAVAPKGARDGETIAGGAGNWNVHIAPLPFVDFKSTLNASNGTVFASTRINSTGGKRKIRAGSYCGLRVFVDGQLVLDKPQPLAPRADEGEAAVTLPQGSCELVVAVNIRWGYCGFQLNLTDAALPRPGAGDKILVPTAKDKKPDEAAALMSAVAFAAREPFVNAGATVQLVAGIPGSLPLEFNTLSARLVGPDGKPAGAALPQREIRDLNRKFWQMDFTVPKDAPVTFELGLEIKAGEQVLGVKKVELYSLSGLGAALNTLEAEVAQRSAQAGKPLPNAALSVEKLRLFQTKIENGEERVNAELGKTLIGLLALARSSIDLESQGKDPFEKHLGYFERAYHSRVDEAAQPYLVNVPAAFAEQKQQKYPLVVFLHGYVPAYDKHRWWEEAREFNQLMDTNGAFLAIPFGRSNADFQSCGEVDVMDVIAEMKRLYPIDEDRVYLYGYSMGGMAVYHMVAHYPDLFAAGIVLAGRADSPLQNHRPLNQFHPYKQWLISADNPISLCENLLNVPIRIYHGKDDMIISLDEARRMEKRLQEVGADVKLTIMNGNHFFGFDVMSDESVLKWLLSQKRKTNPEKRWVKQYNLKYAKQGNAEVSAVTGELIPYEMQWQPNKVLSTSKNIVAGTLNPTPPDFDSKALRKSPQLCGPVREAITGPFIIAYGTSGTPEATAVNKRYAERLAKEWFEFTRSRAVLKADSEVSDAEKKGKNLFLVGEEQDNSLHKAAAPKLPFVVKDGAAKIGEKTVKLQGKGLMYIYPSPLAAADAGRYVVICTGVNYGQSIGANHKFDLLPDFLLFTDEVDTDTTGTNRALCAGFFDGQWKLDSKLTWWHDK